MNAKDREQAAFEDWLTNVCPSGDHDAVQRQWEGSLELAEFLLSELANSLEPTSANPAVEPASAKGTP